MSNFPTLTEFLIAEAEMEDETESVESPVCGVFNPGGIPCTKERGHADGHDLAAYGPPPENADDPDSNVDRIKRSFKVESPAAEELLPCPLFDTRGFHDWRYLGWPLTNPSCKERWCAFCHRRQVPTAEGTWINAGLKDNGCLCQWCGSEYKVDFNVPDDLWKEIHRRWNLLCGSCICKLIEGLDRFDSFTVTRAATQPAQQKDERKLTVSLSVGGQLRTLYQDERHGVCIHGVSVDGYCEQCQPAQQDEIVNAARWLASVVWLHYKDRKDLDPIQQKHLELAIKAGAGSSQR
jgi:hypothetical protein